MSSTRCSTEDGPGRSSTVSVRTRCSAPLPRRHPGRSVFRLSTIRSIGSILNASPKKLRIAIRRFTMHVVRGQRWPRSLSIRAQPPYIIAAAPLVAFAPTIGVWPVGFPPELTNPGSSGISGYCLGAPSSTQLISDPTGITRRSSMRSRWPRAWGLPA
jgi:hypothetical protein